MNTPSVLDSRYSWFRLGIAVLIAVTGSAGVWIPVLLMPAIEADLQVGRGQVSLPYTLTMVGFALGNLSIGRMMDRYGVTTALMLSAVVITIGMGLASLAGSILVLSLLQLIVGFGAGASFGPLMADVSLWFLRRRGIAVAVVASGNYMAGALWPLALAGLMEAQGWRAVYIVLAAVTVVFMLPLSRLMRREVPPEARAEADAISDSRAVAAGVGRRQLTVLLSLAGMGCCVAMAMPQVHIVALCVDMGFGPVVGGQMLSIILGAGVVSRLASGALADWLGGVRTVLLGSVLQCIALMLYLPAGGLVSLYVVSLIFGLAQGGIVPGYTIIIREYLPSAQAGRTVGFVMMATVSGMAIGGWMSGWIYEVSGGYSTAFLNGIAWNVLNMTILIFLLMRTRPRHPQMAAA